MNNTKKRKAKSHFKIGHILGLFFMYFSIAFIIFAWLDYYSYEFFNPVPFGILFFILAIIATIVHVRKRKRTGIDDLVDKL
ncbi:hypothetical protein BMS3Abin03_01424 [bacterium BMS3Abin03]|nr:hypothetical protein BMS3Abin03_01424 [bacterium BMS3Abin03]